MVDISGGFYVEEPSSPPIHVNAHAELDEHGFRHSQDGQDGQDGEDGGGYDRDGGGYGRGHDPSEFCLSMNSCSAYGVPEVSHSRLNAVVPVGSVLCSMNRKDVETWLPRNGYSELRGTNSVLYPKLSSGVVSRAHGMYMSKIMSPPADDSVLVWGLAYEDSLLKHEDGDYVNIKLNYEHPSSSGEESLWHFSNLVLSKGLPSSDNTDGGELVASIVTTDTNYDKNKSRLWFMPRFDEQYNNETPAPLKKVFGGDSCYVVFVGVAYYDRNGHCHIMTKKEMNDNLTIKPACDRCHTQTNEYLTFNTRSESERSREFSLVAVKFPPRKLSGGSQSYFSMSIQFHEKAPSGLYEPVIFLLKGNGISTHWNEDRSQDESAQEYALVPVVKYNMIIVCSTPDSDARLRTENASTSSVQPLNHANASVARNSKRTHDDKDYNDKVGEALYYLEQEVLDTKRIATILVKALGVPCDD